MKYTMKRWVAGLSVLLLLVPLASAFGVSAPYWNGHPLTMEPGQSLDVNLDLQNMVGNVDMTVKAELLSGQDVASLFSDTYKIKSGEKDVPAVVRIAIPESADIGSKYDIEVSFSEVKESGNEFMGISGAVATTIPVVVSEVAPEVVAGTSVPEEPQSGMSRLLLISLMLVALLVLGYYLYKKR